MKPAQRQEVLLKLIKEKSIVDILDSEFVDAYVKATGAHSVPQFYGADTCRQLGRDLSAMHHAGILKRGRVGLHQHYSGMPNWVYTYSLYKTQEQP